MKTIHRDKEQTPTLDLEVLSDIGADDAAHRAFQRILRRLDQKNANTPEDRFWAIGFAIHYLIDSLYEKATDLNGREKIQYLTGLRGLLDDHLCLAIDELEHDLMDLTEAASEASAH